MPRGQLSFGQAMKTLERRIEYLSTADRNTYTHSERNALRLVIGRLRTATALIARLERAHAGELLAHYSGVSADRPSVADVITELKSTLGVDGSHGRPV